MPPRAKPLIRDSSRSPSPSSLKSSTSDDKHIDSKQPRRGRRNRSLSNEGAHAIASEADGRAIDSHNDDSGPGSVTIPRSSSSSSSQPTAPNTVHVGPTPSISSLSSSSRSAFSSGVVSPEQIQSIINTLSITPRSTNPTLSSVPRARSTAVGALVPNSTPAVLIAPSNPHRVRQHVHRHGRHDKDESSSSSSSDSEDPNEHDIKDDHGSIRWGRVYVPSDRRVGRQAHEQLQATYRTHRAEAAALPLKEPRNRYEVETLSLIADAALEGRNDVVYEIAVRRMWGVRHADNTGSWSLASSMELVRNEGYGTSDLFHHFIKQANKLELQMKKASGSGRRSGKKSDSRPKRNKPFKPKKDTTS